MKRRTAGEPTPVRSLARSPVRSLARSPARRPARGPLRRPLRCRPASAVPKKERKEVRAHDPRIVPTGRREAHRSRRAPKPPAIRWTPGIDPKRRRSESPRPLPIRWTDRFARKTRREEELEHGPRRSDRARLPVVRARTGAPMPRRLAIRADRVHSSRSRATRKSLPTGRRRRSDPQPGRSGGPARRVDPVRPAVPRIAGAREGIAERSSRRTPAHPPPGTIRRRMTVPDRGRGLIVSASAPCTAPHSIVWSRASRPGHHVPGPALRA